MPNIITSQKTFHSRKPTEMYGVIESCSYAPYIELFSRSQRDGWTMWGNQAGLLSDDDSQYEYGFRPSEASPEEQLALLERLRREYRAE